MEPERTSTSERLKRIMAERHLKQADILRLVEPIAKKYGDHIGSNALSQYVSGKVEPKQNKLFILSKALGLNEAWLMGFDVDPDRRKAHPEEYEIPEDDPSCFIKVSPHERELLEAYRANPAMQPAINRILNIPDET